jgi:glutamate-1-semialdehyde 2,1-aminomutase
MVQNGVEQASLRPNWLGARSAAEFARAARVVPGGSMRQATFFAPHPPYALHGAGCLVHDVEGRAILDAANNFFSLVHGHAFPPVVEALRDVIGRGTAFGLPTPLETALAEALRVRAPLLEQVRFCNSGTEAVMFAIKAARALTGRPRVAKFEGAYHGAYDHMEVSLDPGPDNWGDDPRAVAYARGTPDAVLRDTLVLPYNDAERCAALIARHAATLCAVVLDPLASRVGMVPGKRAFLGALQEACRHHGVLLIADEIVSFRLAHGGAHAAFGLRPDLVTLGKIIGGGLPVGAVAGPAALMAVFDHTRGKPAVAHGGTFSANPLTMTAGLATLAAYDAAAVARLNALGARLLAATSAGLQAQALPAQLCGAGSLFRLHLATHTIRDYRSSFATPARKRALAAVHLAMLARGMLLTPNCSLALSTPMAEAEIDRLAHGLVDAVAEVHREQGWD